MHILASSGASGSPIGIPVFAIVSWISLVRYLLSAMIGAMSFRRLLLVCDVGEVLCTI